MSFSWTRVGAIFQKEIRDYRRNRFTVIFTMALLPLIFVTLPTIQLFAADPSAASGKLDTRIGLSLLYLLIIPAIVPSVLAAYSVVGEREQGTLEPVLITPIGKEELLVGKALAVLAPTLAVAYLIFGIFLAAAALFAHPAIANAVFERSHVLVQLLLTPLLAGWSTWAGIAISSRSLDVRTTAERVRQPAPAGRRSAYVAQRNHPNARSRPRPRRRPPRHRRSRLASGGDDVRPRATRHRPVNLNVTTATADKRPASHTQTQAGHTKEGHRTWQQPCN